MIKAAKIVIYLGDPGEEPTDLITADITVDTTAARALKRSPADGFWLMLHRGVTGLAEDGGANETVTRWLGRRPRAKKPVPPVASEDS